MKKVSLIVSLSIVYSSAALLAQTYPLPGNRTTHKGNNVAVFRDHNPPSLAGWQQAGGIGTPPDLAQMKVEEFNCVWVYHAQIYVSLASYQFIRNCHDYAWSPFMSCMCFPPPDGDQKECWWMLDPRMNWRESPPSLINLITSSLLLGPDTDYLFSDGDLPNLAGYQNDLGEHIPFPVCPLWTLDQNPPHSALLIFDELVENLSVPGYSYGQYRSKWGFAGIFHHRWGPGYTPPIYNVGPLRIFVPGPSGWGNPPPYLIYWPDPWGPS